MLKEEGGKQMNEKILKEILEELKEIHDHLNTFEALYKFVNRVEMKKEEVPKDKKGFEKSK